MGSPIAWRRMGQDAEQGCGAVLWGIMGCGDSLRLWGGGTVRYVMETLPLQWVLWDMWGVSCAVERVGCWIWCCRICRAPVLRPNGQPRTNL